MNLTAARNPCSMSLARLITIYTLGLLVFVILWTAYSASTGQDILGIPWPPYKDHPLDATPPPPPPPPVDSTVADPTPTTTASQHGSSGKHDDAKDAAVDVVVPDGIKVIGLVFYGRRDLVKVLDCYLKRNMKTNGGLLDEVIWTINTHNLEDLAYLEELLQTHPGYRKHVASKDYEKWLGNWEPVTGRDDIYIKIDDDVVFFEDKTIPAIVKHLIDQPNYFAVSANVVNNPALSWVHFSMGVYEPYWPEMTPPQNKPPVSWRASDLPPYEGPREGPKDFKLDGSVPAPFEGHRWLPMRLPANEQYDLQMSPASTLTFDAHGPSLHNWAAGAQTHYSFLQHLEQGDIWRYKFDIWDYQYQRLSINFFGLRGRDVMDAFPFPQTDDEDYLTTKRPKELQRHVIVEGQGLAVHLAFGPQYRAHDGKGIRWTDLLSRYQAYADENVCPFPNRTSGHVVP